MSWSHSVRQSHRWLSIAFTIGVVVNIVAVSGGREPAFWVYLLALVPLAVLQFTGLYLLVLPYVIKRQSARPAVE